MEAINELKEAINNVLIAADKIDTTVTSEMYAKAPIIIKRALASYFYELAQQHSHCSPSEVPKMVNILTAIDILEELYPELKKK